jgi:hypothetical protein
MTLTVRHTCDDGHLIVLNADTVEWVEKEQRLDAAMRHMIDQATRHGEQPVQDGGALMIDYLADWFLQVLAIECALYAHWQELDALTPDDIKEDS